MCMTHIKSFFLIVFFPWMPTRHDTLLHPSIRNNPAAFTSPQDCAAHPRCYVMRPVCVRLCIAGHLEKSLQNTKFTPFIFRNLDEMLDGGMWATRAPNSAERAEGDRASQERGELQQTQHYATVCLLRPADPDWQGFNPNMICLGTMRQSLV